jgi:hypothetical protein
VLLDPTLHLRHLYSGGFLNPTVRDARKANSILLWTIENHYAMRFRRGATALTAFSDSIGPDEMGTQGARLFALTNDDSHSVAAGVFRESRKVKRVCRSTATGEVLSLGDSYDSAMWLAKIWKELTGLSLRIRLVVNSMGMLKNVLTNKLPEEKRIRIDLAVVRQGLRRADFVVTWVFGRANLSDPLKKESDSYTNRIRPCGAMKRPLLGALRSNCTNLRGDHQETRTQADVSKY